MGRRIALALVLLSSSLPGWAGEPPPQRMTPHPGEVTIDFRGGDAGLAMAQSLDMLSEADLLKAEPVTVEAGDSICKMLIRRSFPPACSALLPTIERLNKDRRGSLNRLRPKDTILFPAIRISTRTAVRSVDAREKQAIAAGDLFKNWANLSIRAAFQDQIVFRTYQMFIPSNDEETATKMIVELEVLRSENVIIDHVPRQSIAGRVNSIPELNLAGPCPTSIVSYSSAWDGGDTQLQSLITAPENARPEVVVIDTPMNKTPDLDDLPAAPGAPGCRVVSFDRGRHHATLLAGIVASRNGHLFKGLAPTASLKPLDWAEPDPNDPPKIRIKPSAKDELTNYLDYVGTDADRSLTVLLAATEFPVVGGQINAVRANPEKRRAFAPNGPIFGEYVLVVASAGQPYPGDSAPLERISPNYGYSPQNLGDLENVVLVTACEACKSASVKVLDGTFKPAPGTRSTITLVAPGGAKIPGWVDENSITAASGTSQAAAFVAGIAASMVARYPQPYSRPGNVKYWLSATAWPLVSGMGSDDASAIVEFGLVDPQRALLNPSLGYVKLRGKDWIAMKFKRWDAPQITVQDFSGQKLDLETARIARIVNVAPGDQEPNFALIYKAKVGSRALERIGPRSVVTTSNLEVCPGGPANLTKIELSKIEDLILPMRRVGISAVCP